MELRNLAEEVTKLSYQNAKLMVELAAAKEFRCKATCCQKGVHGGRSDTYMRKPESKLCAEEIESELNSRYQREASLVAALSERDKIEADLRRRLDDAKRHEEKLENELANMWVLIAEIRKSSSSSEAHAQNGFLLSDEQFSSNLSDYFKT